MVCIENIDHSTSRKHNEKTLAQIPIKNHRNIVIPGTCGTGKSYLYNAVQLEKFNRNCLEEGTVTKVENKYVLIIDDFLTISVQIKKAYIYRILEYRQQYKSTSIALN